MSVQIIVSGNENGELLEAIIALVFLGVILSLIIGTLLVFFGKKIYDKKVKKHLSKVYHSVYKSKGFKLNNSSISGEINGIEILIYYEYDMFNGSNSYKFEFLSETINLKHHF